MKRKESPWLQPGEYVNFSYLSIAWLLRYLQRQNTWVFVWYRLVFGLTILGAIATGWLRNN